MQQKNEQNSRRRFSKMPSSERRKKHRVGRRRQREELAYLYLALLDLPICRLGDWMGTLKIIEELAIRLQGYLAHKKQRPP